jgi:hypothetical protein
MKFIRRSSIIFGTAIFLLVALTPARARQSSRSQQQERKDSMPGMTMDDTHQDESITSKTAGAAEKAMSGHMEMGVHMYMTALRSGNPADDARAAAIVATVRQAIEKYKDYKVALADGFEIFHAEVPQPHYHFTNVRYATEAAFTFNPEHPTSLLYKKVPGGYELEGAMFTARKTATEDELNERVPMSVARWHRHINICLPPKGAQLRPAALKEFGFRGEISTEEACTEAAGRWHPQIFGWMVHVYPYETDPQKIWAH